MDILNERVILNSWASINNGRNGNVLAVTADIQNKGEKVLGRESLPGRAGILTPALWTNMLEKPG